MHAYRILLPSETDDSRFNSREKHMLTNSVQPYNKPIVDLACSVCMYCEISDLCFLAWTSLIRRSAHTKKPWSGISQYRPHARSIILSYFICDDVYKMCTHLRDAQNGQLPKLQHSDSGVTRP